MIKKTLQMKKILSVLGILSSILIFSQISYGIKGGFNLSMLKLKDNIVNEKFSSKPYFYVGGFLENKVSEKFSVQGELLYTELGGTTKVEAMDFDSTTGQLIYIGTKDLKYKIPQISLPILVKFYVNQNFRILGGLNINFMVSPTYKTDFTTEIQPSSGSINSFKSVNINPCLGAEYQFNKNIFAEARYNFGLFDVAKSQAISTYVSYLQIGLGYKFK